MLTAPLDTRVLSLVAMTALLAVGQQAWQVTLPAPVASQFVLPLSGLAAGDGLLVVPAGTKVTTYLLSTNP
jgi:hypothetical protein